VLGSAKGDYGTANTIKKPQTLYIIEKNNGHFNPFQHACHADVTFLSRLSAKLYIATLDILWVIAI
jgi:hypothetical protein